MKNKNRAAWGFLLIALGAAGRALLAVPDAVSLAETVMTLLAVIGIALVGSRLRLALIPAGVALLLEVVLCGAQPGGVWVWLCPTLRAVDLWLQVAVVWLVAQCGAACVAEPDGVLKSGRAMCLTLTGVLGVETLLTICSKVSPASTVATTANSVAFLVFSVLLLWYALYNIRLYNEMRAKKA